MSRTVKKIIRAAGLRDELTFTSFRHAQTPIWAMPSYGRKVGTGRQKVLPKYAKRTMRQVAAGAKKRRSERTKAGHLSELSNSTLVRMTGPL